MAYVDFYSDLHTSTKRDYIGRVVSDDKAECAVIAKQYGADYWDGDRKYGYGGYKYDGRWLPVAKKIADYYNLQPGAKILDVGCGKAYLLYEFTQTIDEAEVRGIDISEYGIANAKDEVKPFLTIGNANDLPYDDNTFDLVYSLTTFHNLKIFDLRKALQEVERVGKDNKHIMVESYRNDRELANLLYWQLTCQSFYSTDEWEWFMKDSGYTGDFSCIYFE